MGLRIVAHIAVRAVANGPSPEVPFEVLGRLEILEQVPRVVDVPTQQAHCPGLVEKEGDGVVVNDLSRVHAPGTVPLEVRVSPQLDVELDVPRGDRDAVMPPGVTEVQVFTMWGGVEIIVPPDMHVESHGIALLGGFEHMAQGATASDPHAPKLRITGVAIMGGVEITVRHPGETARDARQRRRLERRERRRLGRGG